MEKSLACSKNGLVLNTFLRIIINIHPTEHSKIEMVSGKISSNLVLDVHYFRMID
ncbi:MAG: hypothetical protein ACK57K_03585 [Chryseotalea sp.]|nr:hypothetical protein [Cytophagales bacterium]